MFGKSVNNRTGDSRPSSRSPASHLVAAQPDAVVACVTVEICSAAFYLDDDEGVLVSACLFSARPGAALVHPGGRDVLDAIGPAIPGYSLAESRSVLQTHGNMSSPSILFVLEE